MKTALKLVEKGLVPKPLLRHGIRKLLRERLDEQAAIYAEQPDRALEAWMQSMRSSAVAQVPELANQQHYEVPPEFFRHALGARFKYSSGYYESEDSSLDQAEEAMLSLTCQRADLRDGQSILELGCGWGSLSLWMAERYPKSQILAVSNSAPQRQHIMDLAAARKLDNLQVITCDMNDFSTDSKFDRVVSVEMFEHMRNWEVLLERVHAWLNPDAKLFLHVFAHKSYAYSFEVRDESDWMSEHFFSGGMMPCPALFKRLETPFEVEAQWEVCGTHYARTAEDWLRNLERNKQAVMSLFRATYGAQDAQRWYHRWRVFFLSCAELFNYNDGKEWFVAHTLLSPSRAQEPVGAGSA